MRSLYSTEDVAAKFGIPRRTIQHWARNRRISHVKIGRRYFFTDEQIDEIIDAYTNHRIDEYPLCEHPNPAYATTPTVVPMRRRSATA